MVTVIFSVYGVLLLVGAFFGFKAGSKVSLIAGIVSSLFVAGGVFLYQSSPKNGLIALTSIAGLLEIVFLMRFLKTQALMPAGMMVGISAIVCLIGIYYITRL